MVLSDKDRILLNDCLAGQDGAWGIFVERFLPLIVHVVNQLGRWRLGTTLPADLRDDLVAEVLLAVVDHDFAVLRRFQGQSSLGTYLVVITRRVAAKKLTTMKSATRILRLNSANMPATANGDGLQFQNREQVEALLVKLPDREAKVIRMYHLEHRTYRDISHDLGIPEGTIGPLLSQARDRMRGMQSTSD